MNKNLMRIAILCLTFTALNLFAGSDAESKKWIEKMVEVYSKAPLTMDIAADMSMSQGGMTMNMIMSGVMTYADQKHYNMHMDMTVNIPQQGEFKTSVLSVSDGTTVWTEVDNPMTGKQVMKLAVEKAEEFAEQRVGLSSMGSGMDPAKMVEAMEKMVDIQFDGIKDGKVSLFANMTKDSMAMMGQTTDAEKFGKFTIVLDEKNIFPMEMVIYMEEDPFMNMKFYNLNFVKKADLDQSLFNYTPPEGVSVMDISDSLEQMQQK